MQADGVVLEHTACLILVKAVLKISAYFDCKECEIKVRCQIDEYKNDLQVPQRSEFISGFVSTSAYVVFITAKITLKFIY